MSALALTRLRAAILELESLAARPVAEVAGTLARILAEMGGLPALARGLRETKEREEWVRELGEFRLRLARLKRVMAGSAELFAGYARLRGLLSGEYTARGDCGTPREPAILSVSA